MKSEIGKPVENANLILYGHKSDDIVAYSVSDQKGNFSLSFNNGTDSLRLEISLVGFDKLVRTIANKQGQNCNLTLRSAINILPDVIIKQAPIEVSGDTINYNTKSFSDKSDRVIIDVIRKLPGISVTETGQILFNNKTINKFYIDGKDLLEARYSIASNNLPSDAVDQIQVLQDHQPITLLRGIEQSDRAAINIKLNKNAKFRLLVNGHAGLGLSPLGTDNSLTLLKFTKQVQFINTLKYNNVGLDLDQELNDQNFSPNLYASGSLKQDLVSLVKASLPAINQSRYWFNNNSQATGNYLIGINKTFDLKFNAAFEHDRIKDNARSLSRIYLPNDTITIDEHHVGLNSYHKLLTGITLQANTKRLFFKNALQFQRTWGNATDFLTSTNTNQELKNPFVNLINELTGILRLGDNLVGINSYTTFTNLPQRLRVTPGQYPEVLNAGQVCDGLLQKVQMKGFFTDNSASFNRKGGNLSFSNKLGVLVQLQTLNNGLSMEQDGLLKPLEGKFNNEIQRNRLRIYNEAYLGLSANRFNISFGLRTSFNVLENNQSSSDQRSTKFFLNPNLNVLYKFNSFWETSISASALNNASYEANSTFILQNYRSLVSKEVPLQETSIKNISYRIGYKNIINAVYSNLDLGYSKSISNILLSTTFDGILRTRKALVQDNPSSNFNMSWNINKYYLALKTAFNLSLKYNNIQSKQLQQDVLTNFFSNSYTLGTSVNSKLGENIALLHSLDLTVDKTSSKSLHIEEHYATINFLKQSLTLKYFLPKEFQTHLNIEHYYNNASTSKGLNYYFADFTVQKSLLKPKLDFSIVLSNIFNTRSYNTYLNDNNTFINSDYTLRGRMVMFKVGFQF